MSAIQRYPTLTVVLETLLSTLDVLEPLDTLVSAVDVLEPAQALVQSRFNAIKPLLDLLRPVLVVLKPIQNELGHVLAGVKLIYTTLKPVLDPLGEYIAWLFPYALTFVQWEARLLLNAFTTFSVLLSHVTGPWLLPCLRVIMRDPGLKWTAVEHCRGLRLSVLLSATHLGLAYPTEIFDGHSVPEGEDTLLCIIANSLAVVAINLYTGCGFSLTPKFLDEDGPLNAGNVFAITTVLYISTRCIYVALSYRLKGARRPLQRLREYYWKANIDLWLLDFVCLVYHMSAPWVCEPADASNKPEE